SYQKMLAANEEALLALSDALSGRLKEWAHPEASVRLHWHADASQYVTVEGPLAQVVASEGGFSGEMARFGHGMQRSFLFSLLQELSGCQAGGGPRLILACEEPEAHQHPPQ